VSCNTELLKRRRGRAQAGSAKKLCAMGFWEGKNCEDPRTGERQFNTGAGGRNTREPKQLEQPKGRPRGPQN